MTTWHEELRQKFPALDAWCYLNTAAAGPIAREVAQAGSRVYESLLHNGDAEWERMLKDAERARESLATLAGAQAKELAFTHSTSHSVSLVAQMLWESGARRVVAMADEFPASTIPFLHRGFDVRFVEPNERGEYATDDIVAALRDRDVLVSSHVMYRTGYAMDPVELGRLAKSAGAHFILCATQSLGALEVDFKSSGASFLTGTSHKWMCGGYGAGYLVMKEELMGQLPWPSAGWLSNRNAGLMRNDVLDLRSDARVFELGCTPFASVLAMGAAARLWLDTGPERVQARVRSLTQSLRKRLRAAGFVAPDAPEHTLSGITVVPLEDAEGVAERLDKVHVSASARGKGLRLALHAFNDEADIERGVAELRKAVVRG